MKDYVAIVLFRRPKCRQSL